MAKIKTSYICSECGFESPKWYGKCPSCGEWNTLNEELNSQQTKNSFSNSFSTVNQVLALDDICGENDERITTKIEEFDRVLGGGIVKGSLVLLSGDPGIGKSTILLQICQNLGSKGQKILYVSGEESANQIKLRAVRIGVTTNNLFILSQTDLATIVECIKAEKPDIVIIDSIQTMVYEQVNSSAGSITQVRECTNVFMHTAKGLGIPIFIVGHVNKDGAIAGPKVLEHIVDTVLYFEGERNYSYRILRGVKNRFGSTNEIGMFEMREEGMCEVTNPSDILITEREDNPSGSCIIASIEGTRPILVEMQALTSQSVFGIPKRTANGFDYNRLAVLIAVLEKRAGLALGGQDIYLNIAGGMKLNEPAVDLGIIATVASAYKNIPIPQSTVVMGEVGLTGEVRRINLIEKRLKEAEKLGFKTCIIPENNKKSLKDEYKLDIIGVKNIGEALRKLGIK